MSRVLGRFLLGLILFLFVLTCVWAEMNIPFIPAVKVMAENPWGLATLFDLYIGFFIFATMVLVFEKGRPYAWAWAVLIVTLGNGVSLLYLMVRGPQLMDHLRSHFEAG